MLSLNLTILIHHAKGPVVISIMCVYLTHTVIIICVNDNPPPVYLPNSTVHHHFLCVIVYIRIIQQTPIHTLAIVTGFVAD